MNIPINTDGWIAFDGDGRYLTLFLDEPQKDNNGRWYCETPARSLVIKEVCAVVVFEIDGQELAAGEKLKFIGLELAE